MLKAYYSYVCNTSDSWVINATTNSTYFDLDECFQFSVLLWIPCFIFISLSPFWLKSLSRIHGKYRQIKVAWLLLAKTLATLCLIINEIAFLVILAKHTEISDNRNDDFVYYANSNSYILIISFSIALLIVHYERVKGQTTSGFLLIFWTALLFSSFILLYSKALKLVLGQSTHNDLITFYIYFILVAANFIMVLLFVDKSHVSAVKSDKVILSTSEFSNFSRISFSYMTNLIMKGNRTDIQKEDLKTIDNNYLTEELMETVHGEWSERTEKYFDKVRKEENKLTHKFKKHHQNMDEEDLIKLNLIKKNKVSKIRQPSLAWCVMKIFPGEFFAGFVLKTARDVFLFLGPYVLGKLITYVKSDDANTVNGLFWALLMALLFFSQALVFNQYFDRMFKLGAKIRSSLTDLVYKESLILSNNARRTATVGQMINIVSVNAQSFNEFPHYLNMTWSCFANIVACIIILGKILSPASAIAGFVTMVFFLPLNSFTTNKSKMKQIKKLKLQDSRLKNINEMLSGIKIIKFNAWEIYYENIVSKIRNAELVILKYISFLNSIQSFSWIISPFLVSLVSFSIFLFSSEDNVLDATTAFTSLAIFNLLKQPLAMLPMTISNMIQAHVSFKRLQEFLLNETIDQEMITHNKNLEESITCEDCSFGWSRDEVFLKNLTLKIKTGSLTAIVGSVGSGKSSILSACLGEMEKLSGQINVFGTTAYAPQLAWIQNATLRDNILFGRRYDESFYNQVINVCALKTDVDLLHRGDLTEIGEKGINLSGGQKQRINLARCIYADADIYYLDDSLSAVDSLVGKHIFESVIGPNGILQKKTRLFVTNSLNFLQEADEVIYVENGVIVEMGSYNQLCKDDSLFNQFIQTYLKTKEDNSTNINSISNSSQSVKDIIKEDFKRSLSKKSYKNQNEEITEFIDNVQRHIVKKRSITSEMLDTDSSDNEDTANSTKDHSPSDYQFSDLIKKEAVENKSTTPAVLQYFRACNLKLVVIYFSMYLLSYIAQIFSNLWLSDLSNNYERYSDKNDKLYNYGIYFLLGFVSCMFVFFADFLYLWMFIKASQNLHQTMLKSILKCNIKFFESTPVGRIINRFSKDIEVLETKIPEAFKNAIRNGFQVITILFVISLTFPFILIAFIPIFLLYFYIQRFYLKSARQLKRLESVSRSPIYSLFGESLNGISTIRAFKAEKRFISQMQTYLNDNITIYIYDMSANRWLGLRLEFTGTLIILCTSLFTVFQKDLITPGNAGLSISYALTLSSILMWTVRSFTDFETNLISVERINEYCELSEDVKEKQWVIESNKPSSSWPTNGAIVFENFSVRYRKELSFALKDLSFKIEGGERIGIVGRTGAGKSTLSLVLFRLLEQCEGRILIDDVDISTIGLHDLRKNLTIIPQDPVIFSGSLRMNLDPFGHHSDAEVWSVLEKTHLKEFAKSFEQGLMFECVEGGDNLSFGQRQLICLGRALLRKTRILVLDEATAAIDHNTDEIVQQLIKLEFANCTVLTIAHRLNTILDSSRIMVMDAGRIVEFDTPSELLSNVNSQFYDMAKAACLVKTSNSCNTVTNDEDEKMTRV